MSQTTIVIIPEPDQVTVTARQLLDIVGRDRAAEVETVTLPFGFRVPEDVAVEYARRMGVQSSTPPEEPAVAPEPVAEEPPRPRRRGAKKVTND